MLFYVRVLNRDLEPPALTCAALVGSAQKGDYNIHVYSLDLFQQSAKLI